MAAETPYYWVTITSTHYGRREKSEYRESCAIDALPFTWFRMFQRCEAKQGRALASEPRMSYPLPCDPSVHDLLDFRRISKEEYTDAVENEMARSMASLQEWYDSIGKDVGETSRVGPYR